MASSQPAEAALSPSITVPIPRLSRALYSPTVNEFSSNSGVMSPEPVASPIQQLKQFDQQLQQEYTPPSRFILVTCRALKAEEQVVLNNNFKNIVTFNSKLSSSYDLSQMPFDLLIIDASISENHLFLEIVTPSAKRLNVPIIVLKHRRFSFGVHCKLAEALEAFVVNEIKDLGGATLLSFLTKTKLPQLESRFILWLKKALASLCSSS